MKDILQPSSPPGEPQGFIDKRGMLERVPFSMGTLQNRMRDGSIPYIKAGGRKVLFHWPSVEAALLRMQRGGAE